jgi:hypothetical protein
MTHDSHPSIIAGWREWVGLPGLGLPWVKAKLDTGARSSALHAYDVRPIPGLGGPDRVRFGVRPWQDSDEDEVVHECDIHDVRVVRSSSGHAQERYVVLMDVVLIGRTITAEVTLSNRDEMGFRMLVGREALRQGFVVDSALSFAGGRPPRRTQRRNRGRD